MICCIQLCLVKSAAIRKQQANDDDDDEDDECETHSELTEMMKSLSTRMITSEMEDFELVKNYLVVFFSNLIYLF